MTFSALNNLGNWNFELKYARISHCTSAACHSTSEIWNTNEINR